MAYSQPMIDAGSTRIGRWLRIRRLRLSLWVAVIEGFLVALTPDLTKWTVLVIGAILLGFYVVVGRNIRWDVARQLSWIAAASAWVTPRLRSMPLSTAPKPAVIGST